MNPSQGMWGNVVFTGLSDCFQFAMYTMGDGKNVHGTMVAAESKANKGFFLIFMESLKLLEKEYTKRD